MVELLGVLLALAILGLVRLVLRLGHRLARAVRPRPRRPPPSMGADVRGRLLRLVRRRVRRQEDRIAQLTAELERTRLALRLATERERRQAPRGPGAADGDGRFRRAKRAFALHFHPDRLRGMDRAEARLRARIFREFWSVLRQIERS